MQTFIIVISVIFFCFIGLSFVCVILGDIFGVLDERFDRREIYRKIPTLKILLKALEKGEAKLTKKSKSHSYFVVEHNDDQFVIQCQQVKGRPDTEGRIAIGYRIDRDVFCTESFAPKELVDLTKEQVIEIYHELDKYPLSLISGFKNN